MTGGPIDLTPFGAVLKGIGIIYWLFVLAALGLALWKIKGRIPKLLACTVIVIVTVLPVALHVITDQQQQNEAKARLDKATAQFEMRCKSAGEKINRSVENVDGIVWMKWRDTKTNDSDQYGLDDPYGKDCRAKGCIEKLLRATQGLKLDPQKKRSIYFGYRYVESTDPSDGQWYRYTLRVADPYPKLEQVRINTPTARYGITWDDISTKDDRQQWIAGGSLKVVDLQSNEVIAERIGYMMDRGHGNTAGFRSPWLFAREDTCPPSVDQAGKFTRTGFTERFAFKVLNPKQGE
jgi:hypothetical protein